VARKFVASRELTTVERKSYSVLKNKDLDLYRSFDVIVVVGAVFVVLLVCDVLCP
jgi:hypothetical protein